MRPSRLLTLAVAAALAVAVVPQQLTHAALAPLAVGG